MAEGLEMVAQFLELTVDGLFGKLRREVLQAFIQQLKLFHQAAQGVDAFVQARLVLIAQGVTQTLDGDFSCGHDLVDSGPRAGLGGECALRQAQIACHGDLQGL